jgi:hypothetical protein
VRRPAASVRACVQKGAKYDLIVGGKVYTGGATIPAKSLTPSK